MRSLPRVLVPVALALALAGPARAVTATTQVIDGLPQVIVPQQLIVSCNPSAALSLCTSALNSVGAIVSVLGLGNFRLAILPANTPLQGVLDTLRGALGIASAEPNRILIGSAAYPQTWEFPAAGAPGDMTLLPGTAHPIVAVLDSGVAYENYADLRGSYARAPVFASTQFAQGWDFVNEDAHPNDDNGHGTAMASIIAGRGSFSTSAVPFVGPAAGATILPVKVLDARNQGTEFWLAEGIHYAVQAGADVINLSLDFARNYVPGAALRSVLAEARRAGVVVVAASGNTGDGRVLYPAAFPDVLSVGAARLDAVSGYAVASYSNTGDALDLVAPGGMAFQDVNGDGLWDGDLAQSFPPGSPTQISWWLFAGTSPATAHASAAAAALIGSGVSPSAVRPLLQATAADMSPNGWDPASGSGRLQAGAALAQASSFTAPNPLYADAVAALRSDGRAAAAVMIADATGAAVPEVKVRIRWRGAASASQTGTTDGKGIARFVSPAPTSSKKLFLIEVHRVSSGRATQRPRSFARNSGGFGSLGLNLSLAGLLGTGSASSTNGLGIWGYGGSGVASATTGSGVASATTGSGVASSTTGSTGAPPPPAQAGNYPLTLNVVGCPLGMLLHSYGFTSFTASQTFFSGTLLAGGYSVRTVDNSWTLTPGAAAFDQNELGLICGLVGVAQVKSLSTGYFTSGTFYSAGVGSPPSGLGAGDITRLWAEVMNAEGSNAP
ncbi:MAG TPA: S8 family serine peptidase [Myxococcales bacterium]|nr:S8 family serine peptidase [Myxococcales bacterium]